MLIKEAYSILSATNQKIQQLGVEIVDPQLANSPKRPRLQRQLDELTMRYTMLLQHIILNNNGTAIIGTIGENDEDLNSILTDLMELADLNELPGLPIPRTTYVITDPSGFPLSGSEGDLIVYSGGQWVNFPKGSSGEVLVSTPTTIQWQSVVGNGIPAGGAANQHLKKNSNTSYDVIWDDLMVSDIMDITASAAEINILDGVIATTAEINRLSGVVSPIQTQIDGKLSNSLLTGRVWIGNASNVPTAVNTATVGDISADTTNGLQIKTGAIVNADINAAAAISRSKLASGSSYRLVINNASGVMDQAASIVASRVLISDLNGIPTYSTVSSSTLAFLDVTSSIQTQLNNRLEFSSAITPAEGDVIYFNGTDWINLAIGTSGYVLTSNGSQPQWAAGVANGIPSGGSAAQILRKIDGTNYNVEWHTLVTADITDLTASAAEINVLNGVTISTSELNNLLGSTSSIQTQLNNKLSNSLALNALFIGNAANQVTQLAPGSNGQYLTIVGAAPTWSNPPAAGDVSGPGTGNSTDNAVVRWNTTSGDSIQNSNVILGDDGVFTFPDNGGLQTGTSVNDVFYLKAYDVDGVTYINFITLTAANTPTMDINSTATIGGDVIYRSIAGYPIAVPTVTEDGQVITWDNGTLSWIYTAGGGGGGGHVIQNNGTPFTQRANLNFTSNITVTDDAGNDATIVALSSSLTAISSITFSTGGSIRTGTSASNTLLLQAYDVDGAVYTTFGTLTANNTPTFDLSDSVTKSGQYIYRAGGTDVPLADGGTGASLSDPGFNAVMVWDNTSNAIRLAALSGLIHDNGTNTLSLDSETVQDIIGNILGNSTDISLNYDDATPEITASININSVALDRIVQIGGTSILANPTGTTGDVVEVTVGAGLVFDGSLIVVADEIVDLGNVSGSVSIDLSQGRKYVMVQTGNITSFTFTNETPGVDYTFSIERSSNHTFTWAASKFRFPLGQSIVLTNPTLNGSSPAKSIDILTGLCYVSGRLDMVITPDLQNN